MRKQIKKTTVAPSIEETQLLYHRAINFATIKHGEQKQMVPDTDLPYVVHLSNVAMEILIAAPHTPDFDLGFAVQVALLNETLEYTATTLEELEAFFGKEVAAAVLALTRHPVLSKAEGLLDSLRRIKKSRKETWAVKLADRIIKLKVPPQHWSYTKRLDYQQECVKVREELRGGNPFLEERLQTKIGYFQKYIQA
jgi:guanosine-3',5'-bis(diphosphate) 3'-pyrophosphohydrolase